jgi:hypothetical protein
MALPPDGPGLVPPQIIVSCPLEQSAKRPRRHVVPALRVPACVGASNGPHANINILPTDAQILPLGPLYRGSYMPTRLSPY